MTVTKQMSIGEVLSIDRSTAHIFMEFGMHCLGCPHATAESIADACAAHGWAIPSRTPPVPPSIRRLPWCRWWPR